MRARPVRKRLWAKDMWTYLGMMDDGPCIRHNGDVDYNGPFYMVFDHRYNVKRWVNQMQVVLAEAQGQLLRPTGKVDGDRDVL